VSASAIARLLKESAAWDSEVCRPWIIRYILSFRANRVNGPIVLDITGPNAPIGDPAPLNFPAGNAIAVRCLYGSHGTIDICASLFSVSFRLQTGS
jgi:hypothetical protein